MVGVGIKSATASTTYIAGKHTAAATNDTVLEKVLKDCSDKYTLAADSLRLTVQDLDDESYDYAYIVTCMCWRHRIILTFVGIFSGEIKVWFIRRRFASVK
ncbi:unnamed protein product [Brassica oleracea]